MNHGYPSGGAPASKLKASGAAPCHSRPGAKPSRFSAFPVLLPQFGGDHPGTVVTEDTVIQTRYRHDSTSRRGDKDLFRAL